MPKWQLPDPKDLTKDQLAEIVTSIQHFMYVSEVLDKDGNFQEQILPESETLGSDLFEHIEDLMHGYALDPEQVTSKKDWRP